MGTYVEFANCSISKKSNEEIQKVTIGLKTDYTAAEISKITLGFKSNPSYKGFKGLTAGSALNFYLTKDGGAICKQMCNALKLKNPGKVDKDLTQQVNEMLQFKDTTGCSDMKFAIECFDFYLGYFGKPHKLDNRTQFKAAAEAALKNQKIATGIKIIDEKVIERLELQKKIDALKKELAEVDTDLEVISDIK